MNLLKNNNRLLYLELSCRDVLCSADRNAHMFTARDDITALLCARNNHKPSSKHDHFIGLQMFLSVFEKAGKTVFSFCSIFLCWWPFFDFFSVNSKENVKIFFEKKWQWIFAYFTTTTFVKIAKEDFGEKDMKITIFVFYPNLYNISVKH
jgi:hypothetical protein